MAVPASKIEVRLSAGQRAALERLVHTGTHPTPAGGRPSCCGPTPTAPTPGPTTASLRRSTSTVWRVRTQFAAEGLDAVLHKKKAADRQYRKLDGAQEARLVALACSAPPKGQARWTMKLLADRIVELQVVESIDPSTVWRTLQKTTSSRG